MARPAQPVDRVAQAAAGPHLGVEMLLDVDECGGRPRGDPAGRPRRPQHRLWPGVLQRRRERHHQHCPARSERDSSDGDFQRAREHQLDRRCNGEGDHHVHRRESLAPPGASLPAGSRIPGRRRCLPAQSVHRAPRGVSGPEDPSRGLLRAVAFLRRADLHWYRGARVPFESKALRAQSLERCRLDRVQPELDLVLCAARGEGGSCAAHCKLY
mmetsp:Transcript_12974/g.48102  ORF Transcript_12974/g.48102 Transcript_12974/m.48102 type:complete len:213 (+) Transcript_12974:1256-1894(+)